MALRKWLGRLAWAILLAPAAAQAEPVAGCVEDDPALIQPPLDTEAKITAIGTADGLDAARSLRELGDAAVRRGSLATAQELHRRALALRQRLAPRSLLVAESLNALGIVALQQGKLAQAQRYLEGSLRIRRALAPGSRQVALTLIGLGSLARRSGELLRQEAYFRQALKAGDALTPGDLADILDGLGSACDQRRCSQSPQEYLQRALQIREQNQPDSLGVANTLSFLGRSADRRGDLQDAEQDFLRALALRRRLAPGSLLLAGSLTDLAALARERGDLAASELCERQALEIKQRLAPDSLAVADSLHSLAMVFWLREDLEGAQPYLERTLRLRQRLAPGSSAMAQSLIWQGLVQQRREQLADAQGYFTQALELLAKNSSPDSVTVASVLTNLGDVALRRGELGPAQDYFRRALAIQQTLARDSPGKANSLRSLGEVARREGALAEAESYYRRALAILQRKIPGSRAHAGVLLRLASLLRQQHRHADAERLYAQALDVLDTQTARLGGTLEARSEFRARYENDYKDYAGLLVALGRPELALHVLERARARTLLEMLASARVSVLGNGNEELGRAKLSLQHEIDTKSSYRIRLLDGRHTAAELSEVDSRLSELRDRYQRTEEQIQLHNPAYAGLTHPRILSGPQVQSLLDDRTLLLEYSLGPGGSYVWAVTRTTMEAHRLPARATIEQAARRLRELMTARGQWREETDAQRHQRLRAAEEQYPAAARELSRLVLGPVAGLLEDRRLVIVSDGALQYLPFAALPLPAVQTSGHGPGAPSGGDEPLVEQHEVVLLPSASVLAELRRQALQRAPAPKAVAVLADPVFDSQDERIKRTGEGDSPGERLPSPPAEHAQTALRSLSPGRGPSLAPSAYRDRLLWTRMEAAQIMKVTPAGEGLQALDFEASRATALSPQLARYRVVHFATHALSDSEHPESSGLVLSLFDRRGRPQNGFLGLEQIYGLHLPAELVVLSACDTGLGREIDGEGLIGLVRGFMYAGATRVMASLWSVDDEVTAQLMGAFYKSLEQDRLSPVAALRAAQRQVRKDGRSSSPYYWAAFQLEGDWR
jgi:CHAT domain-containing protein/Tfp pilus assembly protein PilF